MLLALEVRFEDVVMNEGATSFARFYAWYRLIRHWTAMRFDDTMGIRPDLIVEKARGIAGQLERTKTSGPGKAMQVLPFFVSDFAYLRQKNWLRTGLTVLREKFGSQRDYLLPLPAQNFEEELGRRALYTDAAGFSRQLLRGLTRSTDDDHPLLIEEAVPFWTEHSDRSGLDSWSAAIGVPKWKRDFLGRWSAQGTSDKYVRTALRVIEATQVQVAAFGRESLNGGPDFFGEEQTLDNLKCFLSQRGVDGETIRVQVLLLEMADPRRKVPNFSKIGFDENSEEPSVSGGLAHVLGGLTTPVESREEASHPAEEGRRAETPDEEGREGSGLDMDVVGRPDFGLGAFTADELDEIFGAPGPEPVFPPLPPGL